VAQTGLRALDSPTLYRMERGSEADRAAARAILDARIVRWTKRSWSTRRIANEIDCSHTVIVRRQARLGVKSLNHGGAGFGNPVSKPPNGSKPESRPGVNKWSRAVERVSAKCPMKQLTDDELAELRGAATFLSHYCSGEQVRRQGNGR
jgi:hypothetical protein